MTKFDLTFEFPHNNSITDLKKRLEGINRFLRNHVDKPSAYRQFATEIFSPDFSVEHCNRRSVQKYARKPEHMGHYILGFFFFNSEVKEIGNLTILLDLGLNIDISIENDAKAISAIAATMLESVTFSDSGDSIIIAIKGTDTQGFLSAHLTYTLNGKAIPKNR